jgi:hypothetical protein
MPEPTGHPTNESHANRNFAILSLGLLVVAAALTPLINFPAGDSWSYGWTIQQWLQDHFVLNDWSSALALPQQILGWIINIGRENVDWSRLSFLTALITIAGLLLSAELPSKLFPNQPHLKDWAPIFAITALAASFTLKIASGFMTDGYYLFFMVTAIWLVVCALNDQNQTRRTWVRRWVGFAALSILASLQRSHGLVLPFITGAWLLLAKPLTNQNSNKDERWRFWFALGSCAVAFLLSVLIVSNPDLQPARSVEVGKEMLHAWAGRAVPLARMLFNRIILVFGILEHFGFAILPVALLARLHLTTQEKRAGKKGANWWYVAGGALFIMIAIEIYVSQHKLFPYVGNSITVEGFGPRSETIALTAGHKLPEDLLIALTLVGTIGGMVLIWLLSRTVRFRNIDWRSTPTLVGLLGLAHLGLVLLNPKFFDRYLVPMWPFAFCWLAPIFKDALPKARLMGWIIVVPLLIFSLWGTWDYLDWTRSKWDLAAELRANNIPPNHILAGYEADGFYNFTNEQYRGQVEIPQPVSGTPWYVSKLRLPIIPDWVIAEKGADLSNSPWKDLDQWLTYSNDRMDVLTSPSIGDRIEPLPFAE